MSVNRKRSMVDRVLSTFDDFPTTKPVKRSRSNEPTKKEVSTVQTPELEDIGIIRNLCRGDSLSNALDTTEFVKANLFDDVPERRVGMNSTRMAELLNFRLNVPSLVTTAHIHALAPSPSTAEREIAAKIRSRKLRRVHIPLRGQGTSSVSDLLISTDDIQTLLRRSRVNEETSSAFLAWLDANPFAITLTSDALAQDDIATLLQAGFLTTAAAAGPPGDANPTTAMTTAAKGSAMSLETIASAASGTAGAVGGPGGSFAHGGGGAGVLQSRPSASARAAAVYQITVPNTGAYLKLLVAARSHLVELLKKSSRRELPVYLLKEYWEAGLMTKQVTTKVTRNPFENLMPGQTKKWKNFYGMKFEWAFEEAFGGGLIELFNTKSVGMGVRLA